MKIKIKNKFRFIVTIIILCILSFSFLYSEEDYSDSETYYTYYEEIDIKKGDTLSSIATKHNFVNKNQDFYIEQIKNINNLNHNNIYAGEKLIVPVTTYKNALAMK